MPHINAAGLALIEQFEGCVLTAYYDPVGVLTIGYGHTGPDVEEGQQITAFEAKELLQKDLARFEQCVNDLVTRNATPNEFAAMVSFAFNLGCDALRGSTLLKRFNAGDTYGAANEFMRWVYAGGHVLAGLERRRAAERLLFLTP